MMRRNSNTLKMRGTQLRIRPSTAFGTAVLLILLLGALLSSMSMYSATAKEVEATNEWTLLGDNDTVAAGMHIRMDMTTGEKWVKLPDNEEEAAEAEASSSSLSSSSREAQVTASGVVAVKDDNELKEAVVQEQPLEPQYDYNMMHRTLSQLPDDVQEEIQLPKLPSGGTVESLSPEARVIFEARLKDIWEERQQMLLQVQEESVADLPQILKDRIAGIREYLENPATHLKELRDNNNKAAVGEEDEDDDNSITDILSILADLEFQLTDVDMTRDFHTLGGWQLVAALLSDEAHQQQTELVNSNSTTKQPLDLSTARQLIDSIQMYAAWNLGTAVKNTGEFTPFVTESIVIGDAKTTAVDLVLQQLQSYTDQPAAVQTEIAEKKLFKLVYCLGSFLRGNREAQIHFGAANGPSVLEKLVEVAIASDNKMLTKRLLNLASDIVTDVNLHPTIGNKLVDDAIVQAYSSKEWCHAVVLALNIVGIEETVLKTVQTLAPFCRFDSEAVHEAVVKIKKTWKARKDMHPDVYQNLIDLADSAQVTVRVDDNVAVNE